MMAETRASHWAMIGITVMRVLVGWHFLYEGLAKLTADSNDRRDEDKKDTNLILEKLIAQQADAKRDSEATLKKVIRRYNSSHAGTSEPLQSRSQQRTPPDGYGHDPPDHYARHTSVLSSVYRPSRPPSV